MKQYKTILLAFFVIAIMGLTTTGFAMVVAQPAWTPNDGDVNLLSFSLEAQELGLITGVNPITFFLDNNNGSKHYITFDSSDRSKKLDYDFTNHQFKDNGIPVLTLGANDFFWFGYVLSGNVEYNYTYTPSSKDKQYNLNFGGHIVQVTDAQPVPLPGAAWLMGAGLLGLVGLRRKYNVTG